MGEKITEGKPQARGRDDRYGVSLDKAQGVDIIRSIHLNLKCDEEKK